MQCLVENAALGHAQHLVAITAVWLFAAATLAQQPGGPRKLPPGPMIDGGSASLETPQLRVELLKYSGTVAKLTPSADATLDYTPGDRLRERSADTFYHLGDLDLRFRNNGGSKWKDI